ncbi:efflux RND transporter periplasmic adaptor subunit [Geoalkalibacter sp.]|uniref:efflux RND transporter periplasmic adaptor subunit n=1 Tax=Geoalkalibacter sp. TaxID=3041440 RepID=UPI00272ED45A|nr:efflux RND transporter periplasmic adaptor subunit [Geoalkalibacter sp.]
MSLSPATRRRILLIAWPTLIMIGLLTAILLMSLPNSQADKQSAEEPPVGPQQGLPVEAVEVKIAPAHRELTAIGTLNANEAVVITAEIAGKISEINFSEGQQVRAGQVLLRLDPSVLQAERDRAAASQGLSEANIRRAELLLKDQAISERERDEAYAQWRLDEASLRLAEAQLAKTVIRAPFNGLLGLRRVSVGAYLNPGEAIVTLDDIDPIKVDFRVPEAHAASLKVGQSVALNVDAVPQRTFSGEVYAIDPQVDVNGRSLLVRARVANAEGVLRPGMFARVNLVLEERAAALMIPEQALVPEGARQLVYRVIGGQVDAVEVEIGLRRDGLVEILHGLEQGDTVITAGQIKVRPGMPVTVLPAAPAPTGNGG